MDLYNNKIVDLLLHNPRIDRVELYFKSGYTNKRDFLLEINRLLSTKRIATFFDRHIYSPRVLYIVELNHQEDKLIRRIPLDYLPTEVLVEKLRFKQMGSELEDRIDYFLEIAGLELKPENKEFIEVHSKATLDFKQYRYYLWAKYLQPKLKSAEIEIEGPQ